MKKLFTLVALLAVFMGAKAGWVQDVKQDYSKYTGFPFYVMGYVPEWVDGVMTDYGANYKYAEVKDDAEETSDVIVKTNSGAEYYRWTEGGGWHQYHISGNFKTELDGSYTVKAMVRASEACTIGVDLAWNWSDGVKSAQVPIGTDWAEVEWEYNNVGGTECWITAKPGTCTATIEWKYVIVGHTEKDAKPTVWQEWLTSDGKSVVVESTPSAIPTYVGDAEFGSWPAWALEKTDGVNINWRGDRSNEICAWSIVRGQNIDPSQEPDPVKDPDGNVIPEGKPRPFPCAIEEVPAEGIQKGGHAFVVHSTKADNQYTDWQAWDNQFFIMSPRPWKTGDLVKVSFKYKAAAAAKAQTQIHHKNPSHYKHYVGIGDVNFTTEWQEFSTELTFNDAQGSEDGGWCVAFNLNVDNKDENTFYFDDLSMQTMVLDEGWFVASSNASTGIEYDYDNAVECVYDAETDAYVGTVGTKGKEDTWVSEVMISTKRGNDTAFKGATIKLTDTFKEGEWLSYTTATLSKIRLSAAGVWQISVAPGDGLIKFDKLEGEANAEPVAVVTNTTVVTVKGQERDYIKDDDHPDATGAAWDNQFFLVANRILDAGEATVIKFMYKANKAAKTSTQTHGAPGAYIHYAAIGDVNFTEEWQEFSYDYTVPSEAAGKNAKSIAFNMAEIKEACDYQMKDFQWYLKDESLDEGKTYENLINAEGTTNFFVKEGAGTNPRQFVDPTGIENVNAKGAKASTAIYNLAGQRVDNGFKGIVIKDGKKFVK